MSALETLERRLAMPELPDAYSEADYLLTFSGED
jgi:hypothetical protein